ncbi:MAG: hypothetical protein A3F84_18870 [Candidatus Handelsmanbacteria bacterium RIFCSPLOWO2_12_FULL_64_10]|uniref:Amine oxidase domain-containing protein n=1 Tax=Handelsmanbacteria sp. (strain RIFCSPLOWO2_12_FULL_64_10) TaxID=1817868 RepID=A0A1F6C405_HANXR|nr:MAG: hypothetical protein A3F84_18870 [Candidatus Handelsmanbacteria bacterium RIFCSPLOWO2_12_FULL_64_10]
MDTDVIIVGAGHNGLVAAAYLARAGLRVDLFERRPFAGGAAITEELWPGFRFSTCAHMTHAIHPKIIRDLRLYGRGLAMCTREAGIRLCPDGTYYGPGDHASPRNLSAEGRLTAEEQAGVRRYGEFKRALIDLFAPYRLGPPPTLEEVRAKAAGTPAAEALERALMTRIRGLHEAFLPSEFLREMYAGEGVAVGRNPLGLHLAYSSINRPEEGTGEEPPYGYPQGGMGVVSRVMEEAAEEAGARVHVNRGVDRFLVEDGQVIGVRLEDGSVVRSRVVVSNLDPKRTFLKLLAPEHVEGGLRRRIEGLITHVSCYKFLAVISELPRWSAWDGDPNRPHRGSVVLGHSRAGIDAAYDDMEGGRPPRAPVISFSIPSFTDPGLTQPGYHTASIWIYPAPARLREGTWDEARERVAERLIDQITAYAPNFRGAIRDYRLRTPLDMERENGLTDGCIWHVQHAGEHLFWNRPLPELAAYRAPLKGLYLCGAGQHPGGEVSGLPGHNAAQEVLKDL